MKESEALRETMKKAVRDIVKNVQNGVRSIEELRRCGCTQCKKALEILEDEETTKAENEAERMNAEAQRRNVADAEGADYSSLGGPIWSWTCPPVDD